MPKGHLQPRWKLFGHGTGGELGQFLLLLADLCALAAHSFEEVRWRQWVEDLINLIIDTRHVMNTTLLKDKCLVVRNLVHNITSSMLNPPPNGGAMINCGDVGPEVMDELFRLHQ